MQKKKIAISITKDILKKIDESVDGSIIRSRSQAIEFFLRKGFLENIDTAIIMLSKRHQKTALTRFKKSTLIKEQIDFFRNNGIKNIFVLIQKNDNLSLIKKECEKFAEVFITNSKKNGDAILQMKNILKNDFIVMSGDIYNNFDINSMIKKHIVSKKIATIGLMSRSTPSKYGTAILDGDFVINFQEKPKKPNSFIVNSGIYIFKTDVFEFMSGSIENDVLPKLARMKELIGFFTTGEYVHFDEL
ncbi:MAG: sugar phosphate nucleotidyltransferase [Candidatus Aenigmatarchaeota archaeon]